MQMFNDQAVDGQESPMKSPETMHVLPCLRRWRASARLFTSFLTFSTTSGWLFTLSITALKASMSLFPCSSLPCSTILTWILLRENNLMSREKEIEEKRGPNLDCSFRGIQKFGFNSFLQVSKWGGRGAVEFKHHHKKY